MFLPPAVIMMSFLRSTILSSRPLGPSIQVATSPVCSHPSRVDGLPRRRIVLEIAAEHDIAMHENLAVVAEPHLDAGIWRADRADGRGLARLHGRGAGGFGEPVGLADRHAEHAEELQDLGRDRRSRRHGHAAAQEADIVQQRAQDEDIPDTPLEPPDRTPLGSWDESRPCPSTPWPGDRSNSAGRRPREPWSGSRRGTSPRCAARRRRSGATARAGPPAPCASSRRSSRVHRTTRVCGSRTSARRHGRAAGTRRADRCRVHPSTEFRPRAAVPSPRQLIIAAFGRPVEPDVKTMRPMSSSCGAAVAAAARAGSVSMTLRPIASTILEVMECAAVVAAQAARIDDDDGPQMRQLGAHLEHLVDLLLILADDHRRLGQRQQVVHLGGRRGRVDAGRDASDHGGAELREDPFAAILADDRDGLAPASRRARAGPGRRRAIARHTAAR